MDYINITDHHSEIFLAKSLKKQRINSILELYASTFDLEYKEYMSVQEANDRMKLAHKVYINKIKSIDKLKNIITSTESFDKILVIENDKIYDDKLFKYSHLQYAKNLNIDFSLLDNFKYIDEKEYIPIFLHDTYFIKTLFVSSNYHQILYFIELLDIFKSCKKKKNILISGYKDEIEEDIAGVLNIYATSLEADDEFLYNFYIEKINNIIDYHNIKQANWNIGQEHDNRIIESKKFNEYLL